MRKIATIAALLIGLAGFGQISNMQVGNLLGITNAQRDALSPSSGQFPIIYNTTAGEFQRWNGAAWETWSDAVTNIDESQLDASVNASLDLADSSVQPGDIDTFAELNAIVADKSLANLNDAQVFSSNIDFSSGIDVTGDITITGEISDPGGPVVFNDAMDIRSNIENTTGDVIINDNLDVRQTIKNLSGSVVIDDALDVRQSIINTTGSVVVNDVLDVRTSITNTSGALVISDALSVSFGASITGNLTATGTSTVSQYRLSALNTAPANASATGTTGEIRVTADYIYVCVATNTWVRAALATW